MVSGTERVSDVQGEDVLSKDQAVAAKVKELADLLNQKGEALELQTGAGVKSFFGLAKTCC